MTAPKGLISPIAKLPLPGSGKRVEASSHRDHRIILEQLTNANWNAILAISSRQDCIPVWSNESNCSQNTGDDPDVELPLPVRWSKTPEFASI